MGLRPIARHPKETEEQTTSNSNEVAEFFSNAPHQRDPATDDAGPRPLPAQPIPSVVSEEHRAAGWYPDSDDPRLMRYWDGFHLTGQVMHVHARAGEAEASPPAMAAVDADDSSMESDPPATDRRATEARVADRRADDARDTDTRSTDPLAPFRSQFVPLDEPQAVGGG